MTAAIAEMRCIDEPDASICFYGAGPKEPQVQNVLQRAKRLYRVSLSQPQTEQLAREIAPSLRGRPMAAQLEILRRALRSRVRYLNDRPGYDTVQSLAKSLSRGAGDCLSLSIAMSALAKKLYGRPGLWRLGGSLEDPSEHIWNVIEGLPIDASDPMPASGQELTMTQRRDLGVGRLALPRPYVSLARENMRENRMAMPKPGGEPLEFFSPRDAVEKYPASVAVCGHEAEIRPMQGVSGATEDFIHAQQQWPEKRKAGLTFGELYAISAFLRNYGVPSLTGSALNESRETAMAALRAIMARFASLGLAGKDQFFEAYRLHVTMYGWAVEKGLPSERSGQAVAAVGWPLSKAGASGISRKLSEIGADRWQRYVAAMAISRDLFAEELEKVGGVQPALQDSVEEVKLEGIAVTGEWQNLAGMWRWKGYDVDGVPLNVSEPLFAKPLWPPAQAEEIARNNERLMAWLASIPSVHAKFSQAAPSRMPGLVSAYNARQKLLRGGKTIAPMPSGAAYAAMLARFANMAGLDFRALFGAKWAAIEAAMNAPAALKKGVSGMKTIYTGLVRRTPGMGNADAAAAAAGSVTSESDMSTKDWLAAGTSWAKIVADLGLGIYGATAGKEAAEQQRKLREKELAVAAQLAKNDAARQAATTTQAPVSAADSGISTTVLVAFGVLAAAMAFKSRG